MRCMMIWVRIYFAVLLFLCVRGACTTQANVTTYTELVNAVQCASRYITLQANIEIAATITIDDLNGMTFLGCGYKLSNNQNIAMFTVTRSNNIVFDKVGILSLLSLPSSMGAIMVDNSNVTFLGVTSLNSRGTVIYATGSALMTIDNGTFIGSTSTSSGGVLYLSTSDVTITNSYFSENYAFTCGGAIASFDSTLQIANCSFSGNSAGDDTSTSTTKLAGGAIYDSGGTILLTDVTISGSEGHGNGGGGAFTNSKVTAIRSEFVFNKANNGGAIAATGGAHSYTNCSMTANEASLVSSLGSGGAVYISGETGLIIQRLTCRSNVAASIGGCAALTGNFTIVCTDCLITGNIASSKGGGIHVTGSLAHEKSRLVHLQGMACNISANSAGSGGGIWGSVTLLWVQDCEISHNIATTGDGGGLYFKDMSQVTVAGVRLLHNDAVEDGGGVHLDHSSINVTMSEIELNTAATGGGMCLEGPSIATLTSCTMNANRAGTGSALAVRGGSSVDLIEVSVENNTASDSGTIVVLSTSHLDVHGGNFHSNTGGTKGGAVICSQSSICNFQTVSFIGNSVITTGGVFFSELLGTITVWDSIFRDNSANQGGGAFFIVTYSTVTVHNCTVARSSTYGKGGAVQLQAFADFTSYDSVFSENTASIGGALHGEFNVNFFLYDTIFESNDARYLGGAFSALDTVNAHAEGLTLHDNTAIYGGAIYLLIQCQLSISQFYAYNNTAGLQGGFLMASGLVETVLQYGTIERHSASYGAVVDASTEGVNIDIRHTTITYNNAARDAGVARISDLATLYMANVTMSDNSAEFGGAVVVNSAAAYFESCHILDSYAGDSGGALSASYSNITLLRCRFARNYAAEDGGVMFIESSSSLMVTECAIYDNVAVEHGGVAFLSDDTDAIFVMSNFTGNGVSDLGGVIHAEKRGQFDIVKCLFVGNTAGGGAVMYATTNSDVTMEDSIFRDNFAFSSGFGGAVHLVRVQYLEVKNCEFINSTGWDGAAIQVDQLGTSATSRFLVNVAAESDGQTFFPLGYDDVLPVHSRSLQEGIEYPVKITGSLFAGSSFDTELPIDCDGQMNGGALCLRDLSRPSLVENCTFNRNVACFGAGLYSSSSKVAIRGSIFEENRAFGGGGGIYWKVVSLSEVTVTTTNTVDRNNVAPYGTLIATNMCKMQVQDHGLESSGSKFETPVIIYMQDFYRQLVTNDNSSVVVVNSRDESTVSGSTIVGSRSGVVSVSDITISSRIGGSSLILFATSSGARTVHTFYFRNCTLGEIVENLNVVQDPQNQTAYIQLTKCYKCSYGFYALKMSSKKCSSCKDNSDCLGGNVIDVHEGYWRSDNKSDEILRCKGTSSNACVGGKDGSNICAKGSGGPYCAVCEDDYTKNVDGTCDSCDSVRISKSGIVVLICVPVVVVAIFLVLYSNREKIADMCGEYYESINSKLEEQGSKVKILFAFVQIIAQFPDVLGTPMIPTYSIFSSYLGVLSFDFLTFFKIDCEFHVDFYYRLLFITLLPVALAPLIFIYFLLKHFIATRQNESNPDFSSWEAKRQCSYWFLALSFAVFSPASTVIIQTFVCESFDDGSSYLSADYSLDCSTERHHFYVIYAGVAALVYPIGTPLFYLYLLRRNIDNINPPTERVVKEAERHIVSSKIIELEKLTLRGNDESISHLAFLFESYRPGAWYFEVVECMRRLCLSAVPALILPGTRAQVIIVLLFSLCFNGLYAEFKPFTLQSDSVVAIATEWGVTMTLLLALLIQVGELEDSFGNRGRVGIVMVLVNVGVLFFTVYKFVYNSDDKHSSALDSFKKNRQTKRRSTAAERRKKRGSSAVVDVFNRFVSRYSVSGRKFSSDDKTSEEERRDTVSPLGAVAVELAHVNNPSSTTPAGGTRPASLSSNKLTSGNVMNRIHMAMSQGKDSDDDDSDDDADDRGDVKSGGPASMTDSKI